jgi:branched-subunit amino acid transport protein
MNETLWILVAMVPAGLIVTFVWRVLGVVAVTRIDPESDVLLWVRAVSTALVAALVMRMLIAPSGVLADISLLTRLAAICIGIVVFYAASRSTNAGTFAGVTALALLHVVLG